MRNISSNLFMLMKVAGVVDTEWRGITFWGLLTRLAALLESVQIPQE
jgi:hypothetical protein